jgi:Calcineurin-like phosphoesterase
MWCQIFTAAVVAIIAILAMVDFHGQTPPRLSPQADGGARAPRSHQTYVIGDLHGDVDCAKYWVNRIGVVNSIEKPSKWLKKDASLVFMGDYIDKGPFSYQTMLFVKSLTDAFPDRVTALMGNHEMEALKDRHPRRLPKYYHMSYAVVHPSEFRNFVGIHRKLDDDDELVIDLLLNATLEVYGRNLQQQARFSPESKSGPCIIDFVNPEHHRDLVKERLTEYQLAYESAFYSNTSLGKWVETLKVAHVENGVFFTHGGVDTEIASVLSLYENIDALNRHVAENAGNERFLEFLHTTQTGAAVEKMLFYRGNHDKGACPELSQILDGMDGVNRLAVGHTPGKNVRQMCGSQFLALDSLLGRWIRTSGNYYCPTETREVGNFRCPSLQGKCQGQVVQIGSDGQVQVIESV